MISLASMMAVVPQGAATAEDLVMPTEEQIKQMQEAAPDKAPVEPKAPRKVLVWGHVYTHLPVPFASKALEILGQKSGAFEATVSDDVTLLHPARLAEFDALVMNNIHEREPFLPRGFKELSLEERARAEVEAALVRKSILQFVAGGKGIVGVHAATAALQGWAEYGELMGGYYAGHITEAVPVKLDDPDSPINACFEGQGFRIHDEIYFLTEQTPRDKYRVLLSLDLTQMDDPGKRADGDYVISLVREYGEGRVFYCSLGHMPEVYWNPLFLKHVLAGIQFALGDLEADATPNPR